MALDPILSLKHQLADEILAAVEHLNVTIAAAVLDLDPARLSDLRHGRVARFSLDRLVRVLAAIDYPVYIQVERPERPVAAFRLFRQRAESRRSHVESIL